MPNLPNILTILRLLLVPVFCVLLINGDIYAAVAVYLIASVTDFFDGYLARKYKQITTFGKFMDPTADKLLQVAALVILTFQHAIPIYITAVILVKELLIAIGGILLYRRYKIYASADWYGKAATVLFYIAIVAVILKFPSEQIALIMVIVAFALSLFAFAMYLVRYIRNVKASGVGKNKVD